MTLNIKKSIDVIFNPFWSVFAVSSKTINTTSFVSIDDKEFAAIVNGKIYFEIFKYAW